MEAVDVGKEVLEEVELLGRTGYFTKLRVDKETVPEGMHCYELRYGDDDGFPVSVERSVRVNYFGVVILAKELELGEEKALQFGHDDFLCTGEQMYLSQIQEKRPEEQRDAGGYEPIQTGEGLLCFMKENGISFQMNEQEADLLCSYMGGHGFVIGCKDGQLGRGDLCAEKERTVWEETAIDDLIDSASEWNYEMIQEENVSMEKAENFTEYVNRRSRYEELCKDEQVLDAMFDRTIYGEQLDRAAEMFVEQFVRNLQSGRDIDGAVKELTQGIKGRQEESAAQQTGQKKERIR